MVKRSFQNVRYKLQWKTRFKRCFLFGIHKILRSALKTRFHYFILDETMHKEKSLDHRGNNRKKLKVNASILLIFGKVRVFSDFGGNKQPEMTAIELTRSTKIKIWTFFCTYRKNSRQSNSFFLFIFFTRSVDRALSA